MSQKIKDFLKSVYGKEILENSIEKLSKNEKYRESKTFKAGKKIKIVNL